jgi:hypothetical protein
MTALSRAAVRLERYCGSDRPRQGTQVCRVAILGLLSLPSTLSAQQRESEIPAWEHNSHDKRAVFRNRL